MTNSKEISFPSTGQFLFGSGMYVTYSITVQQAIELFKADWRIDGHCHRCHQASVFRGNSSFTRRDEMELSETSMFSRTITAVCQRDENHSIWFAVLLNKRIVQKIGQFPSPADIAIDEARPYRKILGPQDSREFSRAIGLESHGVGIGSFVYLRRIFERLVTTRFAEFKVAEGWSDDDFGRRRMDEKINLLSQHLPEFLVQNRKIYAILSQGIHELSDDQCLSFCPVLRSSIIVILEEDKKKKEEMARQKELERAIATFSTKPPA